MRHAFYLGKLFGVQFRLHFTWFIIFSVVTLSLVYPNYSDWVYWVTGIAVSLLFFASVVSHELAHSLVGRANGIPIESIT
ncbi:MAG: site-2 protease family protein, partial [Chloroflexi bacterium]|nr:site-2 protease family protein [Chloroflexota bacterium]